MSVRVLFCCILIACQGLLAAHADTKRPNPPASVCIGSNCVSTPTPGGKIKWNPGHYMASGTTLYGGSQIANVSSEMADLNGWDKILGYRILITWGAIETSKGVYDFTLLDAILSKLKTQYGKPKQLVIALLPGQFGGKFYQGSGSTMPVYLTQSSAYGPSPVAGSYGWWGTNSNGASTGPFCAALFRPAVMDRYIALIQALAAHYDNDPNVEAIMFQEDSWMQGLWYGAPDYAADGSNAIAQMQRLLTASTAAFAHTSVIMENTWAGTVAGTMAFQNWMNQNRIAPGSSDVLGQTAFDNYAYAIHMAWGLQALIGVANGTVKFADMRSTSRAMMDVEAAEISGPYFGKYGGPFTPLDIVNALNQTYKASHAFWTHLFGTERSYGTIPAGAKWPALAATVSANPLTNTSYPPNYN